MPSLLHHVGVPASGFKYEFDGKNFLNTVNGLANPVRDEVFLTRTPLWESILKTGETNSLFDRFRSLDDKIGFKDYAIRTKQEKLIHRQARLIEEEFSCWTFVSGKKIVRSEYEYYDLLADPAESTPRDSRKVEVLKEKLYQFENEIKARAKLTGKNPSIQDYQ